MTIMGLGRRALLGGLGVSVLGVTPPVGPALIVTGAAIRTRKIVLVRFPVWEISHAMRELPRTPSRATVISLDVDKQFEHAMLRDVDSELFNGDFRDGYRLNGFQGDALIERLLRPVTGKLAKGTVVTVGYQAALRRTTLSVQGGGNSHVDEVAFMRATWSVWLGVSDQPGLGDALIARITSPHGALVAG